MQECIKGGGGRKERVTAHPGCGPDESVALCLNILFTIDRRRVQVGAIHHCTHY